MVHEHWLSDQQSAVIEPLIPMNRRGVKPRKNRVVIYGISPSAEGSLPMA
jgi:transposase